MNILLVFVLYLCNENDIYEKFVFLITDYSTFLFLFYKKQSDKV